MSDRRQHQAVLIGAAITILISFASVIYVAGAKADRIDQNTADIHRVETQTNHRLDAMNQKLDLIISKLIDGKDSP